MDYWTEEDEECLYPSYLHSLGLMVRWSKCLLSCDVELAFLLALLVGDVAKCDADQDNYGHTHSDAHVDYFIVDATVGLACERW